MTIHAMAECWGDHFPGTAEDRVLALAIADGIEDRMVVTRAVLSKLAMKIGARTADMPQRLARLHRMNVIVFTGDAIEWGNPVRWCPL